MMKKIKIGDKSIGEKKPCFIIAEAGVNHNGDIKLAKKLIDAAKGAGADAIKFQTFKAKNLVTEKEEMADYQKKNMGLKQSQLQMLEKLELKERDFIALKHYCDKKKIIFLSTPHTEEAIDFLEKLIPAYKVGSGDLTNLPFLKKLAQKKKPIILSTGMSTLSEVREAVSTVLPINKKLILLHCTTNYPTAVEEVNLRAMLTLKEQFGLLVGYSDHTEGILVPTMATTLGACLIEKHFTLDRKLPGPDHKTSLQPPELKEMVSQIRSIEKAMGNGIKKPTKSEEKIKKGVRKSLVARVDIAKGACLKPEMIIIKRPGTGIQPKYLKKIIGKKTKKNIKKEQIIQFKDLL